MLAIITPSRGRGKRFTEMARALIKHTYHPFKIYLGLDTDDSDMYNYPSELNCIKTHIGPRKNLVQWTNLLSQSALNNREVRYLASLGDDHMVRTPHWDEILINKIEGSGRPGIAYGNDLLHGVSLCTSWIVSREIVEAQGWMMYPRLEHMCVDNATMSIGLSADCLFYDPQVIVEHIHPEAGKADWDKTYLSTNTKTRYNRDYATYDSWVHSDYYEQTIQNIMKQMGPYKDENL
jgi:hypothetical protein